MSIWEKIKTFLGMNKTKQIEAPKESEDYRKKVIVSNEYLDSAREQQKKEKDREFQLMFALKNVCGKGGNLFGQEEFVRTLRNTLQSYGYENELNLDELDLGILIRANMNLNVRQSKEFSQYIMDSQEPSSDIAVIVNKMREQVISSAKSFGYNEKMASQYIPTDVISQFEKTIQEEKSNQSEQVND